MDAWLAARDLETQPGEAREPVARVGLAIYYFEDSLEEDFDQGDGK
jgi:hypothetical protein